MPPFRPHYVSTTLLTPPLDARRDRSGALPSASVNLLEKPAEASESSALARETPNESAPGVAMSVSAVPSKEGLEPSQEPAPLPSSSESFRFLEAEGFDEVPFNVLLADVFGAFGFAAGLDNDFFSCGVQKKDQDSLRG